MYNVLRQLNTALYNIYITLSWIWDSSLILVINFKTSSEFRSNHWGQRNKITNDRLRVWYDFCFHWIICIYSMHYQYEILQAATCLALLYITWLDIKVCAVITESACLYIVLSCIFVVWLRLRLRCVTFSGRLTHF